VNTEHKQGLRHTKVTMTENNASTVVWTLSSAWVSLNEGSLKETYDPTSFNEKKSFSNEMKFTY
jgi:hypothetical protein